MRRESNGKAPPFRPLPESGPQCSLVRPGTSRLLPRGRPLADGARQRTAPQCKTLKEKQIKSDFAPCLPTARSMRGPGTSTTGEGRKVDGASDTCRTDSRDPRNHEDAARLGRIFVKASFVLGRARPVFFAAGRKENGGAFSGKLPQSTSPAGNGTI